MDSSDPGDDAPLDPEAARRRLLADHRQTLRRVLECADAVAAAWPRGGTTSAAAVAGPLSAALDGAGVTERLPALLADAATAGGGSLRAEPVAAPPYVAVTSVGPVLRGPVGRGRLVATVRTFRVERDPVRYVRGPATPEAALEVALRGRQDTL